jgi:MobA/VirD2-like, nuclease domain
VIIEGGSYSAGWWWARHVKNLENNERFEVMEVEGVDGESIEEYFRQMYTVSKGTRCKNYFEQWNINLPKHEQLTDEQWKEAHEVARKNHGLEGQPFFRVRHTKRDEAGNVHEHEHCFTLRIDTEKMKAIPDSLTARTREQTARELERKFGLTPVPSVLVANRDLARTPRLAKKFERFRGAASGIDPHGIDRELAEIKARSDNGQSFKAGMEAAGYVLVKGDRRGLLVIDQASDEHSLARRLHMKTRDLDKFMRDVDRNTLPSVAEGKETQRAREPAQKARQRQKGGIETVAPRPSNMRESGPENGREARSDSRQGKSVARGAYADLPAQVSSKRPSTISNMRGAWTATADAGQLAAELEARNIRLARVSPEEARANQRQRAFAKELGRYARPLKEGEIVAVDVRGKVYGFTQQTTGADTAAIKQRLADLDGAQLPSVKRAGRMQEERRAGLAEERAEQRKAGRAAWIEQRQAERREEARLSTPQGKAAQEIRAAWNENLPRHPDAGKDAEQLAEALAARGMSMARATAEEAYQSERLAAFAKEIGNRAPVVREGEIVVVNGSGSIYRLDERTTGSTRENIDTRLAGIDAGDLLSVADATEAMREASRAAWAEQQEKARPASWIEEKILDCERQARISGAVIQQDTNGVAVSGSKALAEQIETQTVTIHGPQAFGALLDQAGIAVVRVTASDELALAALRRDAELAATVAHAEAESNMRRGGMLADVRTGDLAAVDRAGNVYRLNPYKLDLAGLEDTLAGTSSMTSLPSVVEARAGFEIERRQLVEFWTQRRAEATAERVTVFEERAADQEVRSVVRDAERGAMVPFAEGGKIIDKLTGAAHWLADAIIKPIEGVINALGDVLSTPSKPTELQAEVAPKVADEKRQDAADLAAYFENAERVDDLLRQISREDAERLRQRRERGDNDEVDRGREREL